MKILASFLCVLLVVNLTCSMPWDRWDSDSDEEVNNEQSSSEKAKTVEEVSNNEESTSSTTSVPDTTTTVATTTVETTTKDPKIYEIEELIEKISTRFHDLRTRFLKKQQDIADKVESDLEKYKTLRDTSIKLIKGAYDYEIEDINENLKSIEKQKLALQKSIKEFQDDSATKEENIKKVEILKKRSKLLTDMKAVNCDDCDGFLDNEQIDIELKKNDNKIAQLEEKIQKQENDAEKGISSVANQLNTKYLELIHIYQKEVEERKKKEKLELVNSIINDKWKNYGEKVADLNAKVGSKLEKLTQNTLKLVKLTSADSTDDDLEEFSLNPDTFKWISFDKHTSLPTDAVFGGEDTDGTKLYIIRTKKDDSYLYGKFAKGGGRNDVYVTNSEAEIIASSFELLTVKNSTWCDGTNYEITKNTIPICRATHYYESGWSSAKKEIILPGTLLKDGKCRVGFGWKVFTYAENVKVLGIGSCESPANLADMKFWF